MIYADERFEWETEKAALNTAKHGSSTRAKRPSQWSSFMSNTIRDYEEPADDASEAEVEAEFRFNPEQARRNVLPRGVRKVPVTVFLDDDLVAYFKQLAAQPPAVSYQAQINQALREIVAQRNTAQAEHRASATDLLADPAFLQLLDERIALAVDKRA